MANSFSETLRNKIEFINKCNESAPRDLKVKEDLLTHLELDPRDCIADFKDRPFNFKYFAGELAWYLKKDRDISYINNFSNFWKHITNPGTNEINSNYGALVFNEQMEWAVENLRNDMNSRQAIMFFNRPDYQFEGNKDFVCTMYANFFIRDNRLNMKLQMRSNDVFYGLTFDAPFFSFLHQSVYLILKDTYPNLEIGSYYHFADNMHFYERHFKLAEEIISNGTGNDYKFTLNKKMIDIVDGKFTVTDHGQSYVNQCDAITADRQGEYLNKENYKALLGDFFDMD
jgi:thymidylate synthase